MKRSELRQMIKEELRLSEMEFSSQEEFEKYQSKHNMRADTTVHIAGKETTAGDASATKAKSKNPSKEELKDKLSSIHRPGVPKKVDLASDTVPDVTISGEVTKQNLDMSGNMEDLIVIPEKSYNGEITVHFQKDGKWYEYYNEDGDPYPFVGL